MNFDNSTHSLENTGLYTDKTCIEQCCMKLRVQIKICQCLTCTELSGNGMSKAGQILLSTPGDLSFNTDRKPSDTSVAK